MHTRRLAIAFLFCLISVLAYPAIVHVPGDYSTIQSAIDAAGDGDTILIADGTYSGEGNIGIEWDATEKHLVIMSENGRDHCIIDCKEEDRGFLLNNGQDHRDVIDGLTITNGRHTGSGGAICIVATSPRIMNCMLENNTSYATSGNYNGGGAIMVYGEASPLIQGNIIRNNFSNTSGGGILFEQAASGVVKSNVIDGNECHNLYGGGIAVVNLSKALIINNLIINNSCDGFDGGFGGGIYISHTASEIINNTIAYNSTGNTLELGHGGGIAISQWKPYPVIRNCIIWNNVSAPSSMNIDFELQEWLDISYCNVEEDLGHIFDLEPHTNMDVPPEFMDPENGDFRLKWSSPCTNKGNPDTTGLNLPLLDLSGNLRIFEDTVDIGAYEFNHPSSSPGISDGVDFHLYPNPSSGIVSLEHMADLKHDDLLVRIYNVSGELILEEYHLALNTTIPINISKQADGIYFLMVFSNNKMLCRQKIIKK